MLTDSYFPLQAQDYLQSAYFVRRGRNPYYSMRAFARDLELSPSSLCEFLKGKSALSQERATMLARKLELTPLQGEHFCDLITLHFHRTDATREEAQRRVELRCTRHEAHLPLDNFALIANWYHMVILELLDLGARYQTVQSLAETLEISEPEVEQALARLFKLNLIEKLPNGQLASVKKQTLVGDEYASDALRTFHQQILEKASEALTSKPVGQRHFQSIVFSMPAAQVSAFYRELEKLTADLIDKYHGQGDKDIVCSLNTQWIPYTEFPENLRKPK